MLYLISEVDIVYGFFCPLMYLSFFRCMSFSKMISFLFSTLYVKLYPFHICSHVTSYFVCYCRIMPMPFCIPFYVLFYMLSFLWTTSFYIAFLVIFFLLWWCMFRIISVGVIGIMSDAAITYYCRFHFTMLFFSLLSFLVKVIFLHHCRFNYVYIISEWGLLLPPPFLLSTPLNKN